MLMKHNTIMPNGFVLDADGVSRLAGSAPSAFSTVLGIPVTRRTRPLPSTRSRRF